MESLFARQSPKRCRLCVMLGTSLLLHSGLVGIAEMWSPPEPQKGSVVIDLSDVTDTGVGNPTPLPQSVETPDSSTPAPSAIEVSIPTPSSTPDDNNLYEPSPTPPQHRTTVSRPLNTLHTSRAPVTSSNGPASTANNTANTGGPSGAGPAAHALSWVMPHPPYPQSMMRRDPVAATTVHVVTDANGQVSSVVIVKSTGNLSLDSYTESYIRTHWRGPANAARNTEFIYQTR